MDIITNLANTMGIDPKYVAMIIKSIIVLLVLDAIKFVCVRLFKLIKNEKICYFVTLRFKAFITFLKIVLILLIWLSCLSKITTLLSFISASLTFVIRDFINNYLAGIYIKARKPFKIEDRIEINGHKGDVVNINNFSFDLLEVNSETLMGQSTGVMIHIPNAEVFNYPLRNYNTAFKYIWNEVNVRVPLDSNIEKVKKVILDVVNNNDIVKEIPDKLHKELEGVSTDYRIYYNNLEPVIYVKVQGNYVELTARYLVHPKKARLVSSAIWDNILKESNKKKIILYKE